MNRKIRRFVFNGLCSIMALLFVSPAIQAQSSFEDAIEQMTGDNTRGYLQPFIDSFGNNLNSGIYRGTGISPVGLNLYVGVVGMFTSISDEDLTFMATPPSPYPQTPVSTATVFGESGARVDGPSGLQYYFQDGQIQGDLVPLAVPHLEVGSILGTNFIGRYFSADIGDMGEIKLVGYGLRHSVSQYIPLFPINVSVGYFRQTFDVGDIISATATSIGIQATKSFPVLTIYGAVASESSDMDVEYVLEPTGESIGLNLESDSGLKITAGARLALGFLILNGDFNLGKQNAFTVGAGIGF